MDGTVKLIACVSLLITLSSFIILSWNIPTEVEVSREQAIAIVKASIKVDPGKNIVEDRWLQDAELQYLAINWVNYLRTSGSHNRIYVSTSPVGYINPYWFIDYASNFTFGSYIVDAARQRVAKLHLKSTPSPPE